MKTPFIKGKHPYGAFHPETGAFHLRNILTPRPWANVLSNGSYGAVISHMGGGFSWVGNSQLQRLTRWEQDLVLDQYGRSIFVTDLGSGDVESTTFAPTRRPAQKEDVEFGLGYMTYRRSFATCETEHTVFVPTEGDHEHWLVTIRNSTSARRTYRVGGYLEWFLGNQSEWHREFHRLFVSLDTEPKTLFAWKRRGLSEGTREAPEAPSVAYLHVEGLAGLKFFTDKLQFVGRAGNLARPQAVTDGTTPRVTGRWDDPVGAFTAEIELGPGEEHTFAVTLGMERTQEDAQAVAGQCAVSTVEARLSDTQAYFRARNGQMKIETGDAEFDLMNNAWLPYQAETGRILARSAYYQQGGAYGYRDQLQDSLVYLETEPELTLKQLIIHAEAMFIDGGVRHWWHPNSDIVAESHHSDTCLWLAFGTLLYLEETADLGALDQTCRYLDRATRQFSSESGTLLDHCLRGIDRSLSRQSERGLPLIGAGDWNDGLSHTGIDGKGESVWLAMFLYQILGGMAGVLDTRGDSTKAAEYRSRAAALKTAVEEFGWDGDWYIAGTSDNGRPFGAAECAEGSIFLNPQTWAAITGIGSPERIDRALDNVRDRLVKPYGALLLAPAFRNVDPYVGYITRYAPGMRENGGVYSHASTWAIEAFAQRGEMATAYELYQGMLPTRGLRDVDSYEAEPFVMPGNVDGPDSPYEGRAGWTWYTGSAAWMRRTAVRWIIGVRATFAGLVIEPTDIPALGEISLVRKFRGDTFNIRIEPGKRHEIRVDGKPHSGPIAASGLGQTRTIEALAIE
ncbi:MAG: hypothetical protein JNJ45_06455 [Chthonomonas sp.]|nr:hypothetical protein [Chthonomonas sp.]